MQARTEHRRLTAKQQEFVRAFTAWGSESYQDATASARVAGYGSPHPRGSEQLRLPHVREAIEEAMREVRAELQKEMEGRIAQLGPEYVLEQAVEMIAEARARGHYGAAAALLRIVARHPQIRAEASLVEVGARGGMDLAQVLVEARKRVAAARAGEVDVRFSVIGPPERP